MINKTEIFRKIGGILEELNEQYQYMAENPGNFNELELELFSANADFLSEHTKVLLKLSAVKADKPAASIPAVESGPSVEVPVAMPPVMPDPAIKEVKENIGFSEAIRLPEIMNVKEATPAPSPEIPVEEELLPPAASFIEDKKPSPEENRQESFHNFHPEPEPVPVQVIPPAVHPAEKIPAAVQQEPSFQPQVAPSNPVQQQPRTEQSEPSAATPHIPAASQATPHVPAPSQSQATPHVPTINEIISGNREKQAGQFSQKQITDLKSGINLNDKLLFIKDLFNGYSLAYSEAIEILNRFDSFEAADNFLKANYALKNNWSEKQAAVDKFFDILHKRFS